MCLYKVQQCFILNWKELTVSFQVGIPSWGTFSLSEFRNFDSTLNFSRNSVIFSVLYYLVSANSVFIFGSHPYDALFIFISSPWSFKSLNVQGARIILDFPHSEKVINFGTKPDASVPASPALHLGTSSDFWDSVWGFDQGSIWTIAGGTFHLERVADWNGAAVPNFLT